VRILFLLIFLAPLQEKPEWKRLEEALRPPKLAKYDITTWPGRPLSELSSPEALALLGKFAERPGDLGLKTPVERALFQRLLWAYFDGQLRSWKFVDTRRFENLRRGDPPPQPNQEKPQEILALVARLIQALALTEEEIRALPDPYAKTVASKAYAASFDPDKLDQPFLPQDLEFPDGPWVSLGNSTDVPLALRHANGFAARSSFHIYLRAPAGRAAALELIKSIEDYRGAVEAPTLPIDAQVALLERPFLITREGKLVPSPLTETVEFRIFHKPEIRSSSLNLPDVQPVFRFKLRPDLFASGDAAPLRARLPDRKEDFEPFSQLVDNGRLGGYPTVEPATRHCSNCHSHKQARSMGIYEIRSGRDGKLQPLAPGVEIGRILKLKEKDVTWTELMSLWK